jgi:hypothetical protein
VLTCAVLTRSVPSRAASESKCAVLACAAYFHSMAAQQAASGGFAPFRAVLATEDCGLRLKVTCGRQTGRSLGLVALAAVARG